MRIIAIIVNILLLACLITLYVGSHFEHPEAATDGLLWFDLFIFGYPVFHIIFLLRLTTPGERMRITVAIIRTIAIVVNILFLTWLISDFIAEPPHGLTWLILFMFGCPVLNIIVLSHLTAAGWVRIFCERKTLKEKKKIEALEKQGGEE